MAVDIDLNIYKDATESEHLGCINLYFLEVYPQNAVFRLSFLDWS